MPTINDVARKAGVSKATVSRVLNGLNVMPVNREKVLKAVRRLNYRPNAQARGLGSGRTRLVGVIIPGVGNSFYGYVIEGICSALEGPEYNVVLCSTWNRQGRELAAATLLRESRVDGIIFVTPREVGNKYVRQSMRTHFPFVLVDGQLDSQDISCVVVDNVSGGYKAVSHLVGLGHRRIGLILGYPDARETHERTAGYRLALCEAGIEVADDLVLHGNYTTEGGYRCAMQLLGRRGDRPSAIFAANDTMAFGVIQAAEELGLHIPGSVALVGYDDIEPAALASPKLTTVRQPLRELGKVGAQKLLRIISREETEPTRIVLPVELVVRESSGVTLSDAARAAAPLVPAAGGAGGSR